MSDGGGWNALFLNNHDQPRSNSRFGDTTRYPYETATMLAQSIQFLRGTPYIYQGEEIGMTNPSYEKIDQYDDIETHNMHKILLEQGKSFQETMAIIQSKSRDNSRTPMQWDDTENAGFSQGTPWLEVPENYEEINVTQEIEREGIFKFYQQLIQLRKEHDVISKGTYEGTLLDHPQVMGYIRRYEEEALLVLTNYYDVPARVELPAEFNTKEAKYLHGNYKGFKHQKVVHLRPYETISLLVSKNS